MPRRYPHQHFVLKERQCILPNAQCAGPITKLPQYTSSKSAVATASVPRARRVSDLLQFTLCALVIVSGFIMVGHLVSTVTTIALILHILDTVAFISILLLAMIAYKKFHGIKLS